MEHRDPPVIRIVKKGHGHPHHGGAWKVAFADFVTAMMALFIVLWILGQSEDVKRGIGGYFRDPTGKALLGAGPSDNTSKEKVLGRSVVDIPTLYKRHSDPQMMMMEEADKLRELIEEDAALGSLGDQITVDVTPEGVRVEINETQDDVLFETGSSKMSPKLVAALQKLASEFSKQSSPIAIEGHTDSTPYASGSERSNFELSSERANEARRVFEASGIGTDRIFMIRGYADRIPKFPDPKDPRNRRISFLLMSDLAIDTAEGRSSSPYRFTNPDRPPVSLKIGGGTE